MTKYGPESKDLWIQARVDELMDDEEWLGNVRGCWILADTGRTLSVYTHENATIQATREHAEIEAMILDAQIDNLEMK